MRVPGSWGRRGHRGRSGAVSPLRVVVVVGVLGVAGSPRASSSWCSCSIMFCVCIVCVVFLACHVFGCRGTRRACTSHCCMSSHARVHHIWDWYVAYLLPLASASPGFCLPAVVPCRNCALFSRSAAAMWRSCITLGRFRWCVVSCHVVVGCGTMFSVGDAARRRVAASSCCVALDGVWSCGVAWLCCCVVLQRVLCRVVWRRVVWCCAGRWLCHVASCVVLWRLVVWCSIASCCVVLCSFRWVGGLLGLHVLSCCCVVLCFLVCLCCVVCFVVSGLGCCVGVGLVLGVVSLCYVVWWRVLWRFIVVWCLVVCCVVLCGGC